MKRTLKRESKVLEIVGGEALEAGRSPPVAAQRGSGSSPCRDERPQGCLRGVMLGSSPRAFGPGGAPASAGLEEGGERRWLAGRATFLQGSLCSATSGAAEVPVGSTRFIPRGKGRGGSVSVCGGIGGAGNRRLRDHAYLGRSPPQCG
jgi:hypothetical protein